MYNEAIENTEHDLEEYNELKTLYNIFDDKNPINIYRQAFILLMTAFDAAVFDLFSDVFNQDFFNIARIMNYDKKFSLGDITKHQDFNDFASKTIDIMISGKYVSDVLEILHAHKKSTATGSCFRINVEGSHPAYSFHYISKNPNSHNLFVFEAPIDLLSYISLHPQNWKNASYGALNGVSQQPVLKMLELYPQLQRVTLCLDNDKSGRKAASRIHKTLQQQDYKDVVYDVSAHKDWNEDLKAS